MIVVIDESGPFQVGAGGVGCFVAVQIRQRRSMLVPRARAFTDWESTIGTQGRDATGEVKGRLVSDADLARFCRSVIFLHPECVVTPVAARPADNPAETVDHHRSRQLADLDRGIAWYEEHNRPQMVAGWKRLRKWLDRLSYDLYLKTWLLAECLGRALENAVGSAAARSYDDELVRLRFVIDRDFVQKPKTDESWHELLRFQLTHVSNRHPVPIVDTWERKGHPFIQQYTRDGGFDFGPLFRERLRFVNSADEPLARIADIAATIVFRQFNREIAREAWAVLREAIPGRQLAMVELEAPP